MARTKEFDPDATLRFALELFWERGYEATSMADLVEHLGIGRASIYATSGNKHDLYLEEQNPDPVEASRAPGTRWRQPPGLRVDPGAGAGRNPGGR